MGESDWADIVGGTEAVRVAYVTPLQLSACKLHYTQIDERETSVTLGFETCTLPSNPPAEWTGMQYNTVEFYLKFTDVKDLRVTGWTCSTRDAHVALRVHADEGIRVSVEAMGSHLAFTASTSFLTRMRSYLAGRE